METYIGELKRKNANEISKWKYEEPYSIYSMDEDCIDELLDGSYYAVTDSEEKLIGYYCFGESAQVPSGKQFGVYDDKKLMDIGLGINPNLCGNGLGSEFLKNGIQFARKQLHAKAFRLTVAAFNKRAIKVYERIGFQKVHAFTRSAGNVKMEFMVMVLV